MKHYPEYNYFGKNSFFPKDALFGWREPQTPGIGGLEELTSGEEAVVQAIDGGTFFRDNETPTGTIDGTNKAFTLANTPSPAASLILILNGVVQTTPRADYTLATATITYVLAPPSGSKHKAWYRTEP